jgi:hypothetical protein
VYIFKTLLYEVTGCVKMISFLFFIRIPAQASLRIRKPEGFHFTFYTASNFRARGGTKDDLGLCFYFITTSLLISLPLLAIKEYR